MSKPKANSKSAWVMRTVAPPVLANLVAQLVKRRAETGMTQADLEHRAGIPDEHLGRLERGERHPSAVTIAHWCQALGVMLVVVPGTPLTTLEPAPRPPHWHGNWKAAAGPNPRAHTRPESCVST